MIQKLAKKTGAFLVAHGLPAENEDIYRYGMECLLNLSISFMILLVITSFLHCIPELLVWMISFTVLRNQLGGYHANSHWKCILATVALCLLCLLSRKIWFAGKAMPVCLVVLLIASFIVAIKIAPVLHPNHPLSFAQQDKARIRSIVIFIIEFLIIAVTYFTVPVVAGTMISSLLLVIILAILGYYLN